MVIVVIPFLYVGNLISKNFAALLEEHEIFVPDDDDDDDWAKVDWSLDIVYYHYMMYLCFHMFIFLCRFHSSSLQIVLKVPDADEQDIFMQ